MSTPVFDALLPVVLFIALGFMAGRLRWIQPGSVKDLSNLVFMLLTPALLFRTMAAVRVQDLNFGPVGLYFAAAALLFAGVVAWVGFGRLAAARGLAGTFGNTIMIGVPLVGLAFGEAGLVHLFTLISVHSLILLTAATVVFELAAAREQAGRAGQAPTALWRTIVHPVPLPILAGLAFAQTGWKIPPTIDQPLRLLGQALGPLALLMVGITLAFTRVQGNVRLALGIALLKNLGLPLVFGALGWLFGLRGLALAVMLVAASLPVGANVFLFAQRYGVAQEEITASIAVSTALALLTLPMVLLVAARLV